VHLWDARTQRLRSTYIPDSTIKVTSTALSQDGRLAAIGHSDGTIGLLDIATGHPIHASFGDRTDKVTLLSFSLDGSLLASWDGSKITIWNTATGQSRELGTRDMSVTSLAFSPNGQLLVTGDWDNTFSVWDILNGQLRNYQVDAHGVRQGSRPTTNIFSP